MIRIFDLEKTDVESILKRAIVWRSDVEQTVKGIMEDVKTRGDEALYEYTERFDGVKLSSLRVSEEEIKNAVESVDPMFLETLKKAKENIAEFHKTQIRESYEVRKENGTVLGQRFLPVESAGIYVPGGTAAYPSSVLMNAIPALIANVERIVMVTPPQKDGTVAKNILAAAHIAGITEIYKVGGAQAVAALSYGTQTIPKVYKIVGPGNIFVATAKRQALGLVGIDMFAGPSEILVIADSKTSPVHAAADLLSQAEHDKMASAVLITDSVELAYQVQKELEMQIPLLEREEICRASIDNNGMILITSDLMQAVAVSNELAPEHLELCVDNPFELLPHIKNAGSVFMGRNTPEALGDYFAGVNHVLPTNGTAHFSSPLSVDDFIKRSSYLYYTKEALVEEADDVIGFAEHEGLTAHGNSVYVRVCDEVEK